MSKKWFSWCCAIGCAIGFPALIFGTAFLTLMIIRYFEPVFTTTIVLWSLGIFLFAYLGKMIGEVVWENINEKR